MSLRNIEYPITRNYNTDSDHPPIELYLNFLPHIKTMDLELGYFNSSVFSVLAIGMAQFIQNGGKLRIVTNSQLNEEDREVIFKEKDKYSFEEEIGKYIKDTHELEKLKNILAKRDSHFFNCLLYLKNSGNLIIVPVKPKLGGIAHNKRCVISDGENELYFSGSANFTGAALLKNAESIDVFLDWDGDVETNNAKIKEFKNNFESIINKKHSNYHFLKKSDIETKIHSIAKNKSLENLLDDELNLDFSDIEKEYPAIKPIIIKKKSEFEIKVRAILNEPHFPYFDGIVSEPRQYQKDAYKAWVKNNHSGVFAMATGTGKTITALNCLLNEYKTTKKYKAIILVPSIALLNQWEEEVKSFNFKNILKVGGGNKWEDNLGSYVSNYTWGIKDDLVIISTYGSFVTERFQKYFKKIEKDILLIADEAHNMGANNIKKRLQNINVDKKIGLSATPKRVYDPEGTDAIDQFFNDSEPYTYTFSMERALKEDFLAEYKYFPILVELNEDELEEYIVISKKLLKFFDFEKGEFKKDPMVEILLLKRKNIIHKAHNKLKSFKSILIELEEANKLNYVFTYIPEGYVYTSEVEEPEKLLNKFIRVGIETIPQLKMNSYTSEDEDLNEILQGFSEGKIDLLFAMKMLDEGVDVPRAEVGVFCSSTGNPRQFIQRRGRLLRKHKDKAFATIYDMVVIPPLNNSTQDFFRFEQNMVKTELRRVAYFASLSMNYYDSRDSLLNVCNKYDLNLDKIIEEL